MAACLILLISNIIQLGPCDQRDQRDQQLSYIHKISYVYWCTLHGACTRFASPSLSHILNENYEFDLLSKTNFWFRISLRYRSLANKQIHVVCVYFMIRYDRRFLFMCVVMQFSTIFFLPLLFCVVSASQ